MPRSDQLADPFGMGLGIGERQRRAPRAAEHLPALDAEVRADRLHVGDEIPGRVLLEFRMGVERPAAALVEQDHAVGGGIVEARHGRVDAGARAAVQHDAPACPAGCRIRRRRSRAAPTPSGGAWRRARWREQETRFSIMASARVSGRSPCHPVAGGSSLVRPRYRWRAGCPAAGSRRRWPLATRMTISWRG